MLLGHMSQTAENGTPHPALFWLAVKHIYSDGKRCFATPHSPGTLHMELTTAATKGVGYLSVVYKTNREKKQTKEIYD